MPELVDLEVARRNMLKKVRNRKVISVKVNSTSILKNCKPDFLTVHLTNRELRDVERVGKMLLFDFGNLSLIVHLMLYGDYIWSSELNEKRSIFDMCFDVGDCISITDSMNWVKIELDLPSQNIVSPLKKSDCGIDPLSDEFTYEKLNEILKKKSRSMVKAVLMDQKVISGIGNAYSDEILWDCKIHPCEKCLKIIEDGRSHDLFDSMRGVLDNALKKVMELSSGVSISEQKRDFMKVYRKERFPCPRCNNEISRISVCGRDTFVCDKCQTVHG